ncbi:MAG TPA: MFS transporter [Methylomirabilota bacterium]|nr:MFS transporter [Methylomirabilota bacterium]
MSERAGAGWGIVAAAFLTFAVSAGLMHSYPVFFVAFLAEFGWGRAQASLAYSASQLLTGASSPVVGVLVDRVGPRRLVFLGGVALALGLALSARVSALWHLIALYGVVMTVGANCLGLVVLAPLVARHFATKRGLVLSIVQAANGFGRAGAVPVVQFLITTVGWRRAYLALAAVMAIVIVPLARSFRSESRATPRAEAESSTRIDAIGPHDWTLREAMATPHFWLLFLVYLLTGLGSFFVSLHQLAFLTDVGFDALHAASVLGMGAFLSVAGTIFTGTISDYVGREVSAILAYGISIVGVIAALFITSPDQTWLLWVHSCFFGLTWGARGPMITAKTADLFQGRHLGAILGAISIGTGIGAAVGAWASGLIFDVSGSYRLAFLLSIVSYLAGCVAFWFLRRPAVARA